MSIALFTDWDGVLVNCDLLASLPNEIHPAVKRQGRDQDVGPHQLGLLNGLCSRFPDIRIVCSSSWRTRGKEDVLASLKDAHERFSAAHRIYTPFAIRFHEKGWRTSIDMEYDEKPRGRVIEKWIQDYGEKNQRFIIVDDEKGFSAWQQPHLIQTDGMCGITQTIYNELEYLIEHPPSTNQTRFDFTYEP